MARLVLDRSEHAGMLARSKEVILALDSQHGIYRERVSADAARSAICLKMPTRSLVTIDRDDGLLHFPAIGR